MTKHTRKRFTLRKGQGHSERLRPTPSKDFSYVPNKVVKGIQQFAGNRARRIASAHVQEAQEAEYTKRMHYATKSFNRPTTRSKVK